MPGKSANPVPKPSHTWQTPQNTEWNSRIQERRILRERFMPSTDLALVGGFQTAAGWGVTGLFGCCTALSLYSLFASPNDSALIPSLIFAAFTIGGGILLKKEVKPASGPPFPPDLYADRHKGIYFYERTLRQYAL